MELVVSRPHSSTGEVDPARWLSRSDRVSEFGVGKGGWPWMEG
ncbi:hypothetical protein M6B38_168635 [Iris pallida]|uniref:Uncharacterized protein n=1 Tax=Iris pallida TaxID=29817 RepID=A0AAX6EVP9_IRIPA|nr:hypothetical protein M6B38_203080 [Iris pallida]KAJ6808136.1 hypothetical protein M6B38_168635 [Iris pallida]